MAISGAPKVTLSIIDKSTVPPEFQGIYSAICIPAFKGNTEPQLITNVDQFLREYTPNGKIEVGYDLSFYSAMRYLLGSNKLFVKRVIGENAFKAGIEVNKSGSTNPSVALSAGIADPNDYEFGTDGAFVLYVKDEGEWGNKINVEIITDQTKIKEDPSLNPFIINVYTDSNDNYPIETFVCSLKENAIDGYGRTMTLEEALKASDYIRAFINPAVDINTARPAAVERVQFSKGDDGDPVTEGDMVEAVSVFENKIKYPITILLSGGSSYLAYQQKLIQIAEKRQDCIAILTVPQDIERRSDYLNAVVEYRTQTLNANTYYAALYSSWIKIFDYMNDRRIYISPDGDIGAKFSQTSETYEPWYPVGGSRRGVINCEGVLNKYDYGEMDYLYENNINPIYELPGKGIRIWGQKTLLNRPSRLDRLNVIMLLIVIGQALVEALEDFLFEVNDAETRRLVYTMIDNYMAGIRGRRGVTDYYIYIRSLAEEPNENTLTPEVYLKPVGAVEYIPLKLIVVPEAVSFQVVMNG
jgi:phage tail sheath protein FI